MSPPEPVRLGVLGAGWIARNRLRQVAPERLAEVTVVVDPADCAREAVRQWAPRARHAPDLDALTPESVDAVMISTPNALHASQALTLLERGLPVFVQKPLGVDAAEAERVLDRARGADLPLAVDFCYRDLVAAEALRRALQQGTVGSVHCIEACFHNAYRPNAGWSDDRSMAGGGALLDLGIHLLDLVMWSMESPAALTASRLLRQGAPLQDGAVEDFARLDLCLSSGTDVRVMASWDASVGLDAQIVLRCYGQHGTLELHNLRGSFFDFETQRFQSTGCETLGADAGDHWQGRPLARWLKEVQNGAGFTEPAWVRQTAAVVDEAYALAAPDRESSPAEKELHQ